MPDWSYNVTAGCSVGDVEETILAVWKINNFTTNKRENKYDMEAIWGKHWSNNTIMYEELIIVLRQDEVKKNCSRMSNLHWLLIQIIVKE